MSPALEVAAGVIVDRRGVLVTRRRAGAHMGGLWEFPGGKIRPREGVVEALLRELREELGIETEIGRLLMVVEHTYPDAGPIRLHFHVCRIAAGEPRPLAAAEVRWLPPSALAALRWPPADAPLVARISGLDAALDLWGKNWALTPTDR